MREQTPLENFVGFMKISQSDKQQEVQDFIINDENELKQCVEAFGEPLNLLTTKEF